MSPSTAVCIRCGYFKPEGVGTCKHCGFRPRSLDDRIRSLYFEPRFVGEGIVALSASEIETASSSIKAGRPSAFDPARLSAVASEYKRVMRRFALQLAVIFVPMLAILAFLYWRASLS